MAHEKLFADGIKLQGGQFVVPKKIKVSERGVETEVIRETMVSTSDTKQFFTQGVSKFFMNDPEVVDNGWQDIFTVMRSTSHGELFPFRNPDRAGQGIHGIVFEEVGELGEIKFSKVTSNEKYVKNVKYGTAIGYSNEWFQDGSMGMIEMTTRDFRQASSDKLASIHYAAIAAAVSSGVSLSAAQSGTELSSFINALDVATVIMRRNRRNPRIILGPPEVENYLSVSLSVKFGFMAQNTFSGSMSMQSGADRSPTAGRYRLITTDHLAAGTTTSTVYVIEPKNRLMSTDREQLTLGNFQDLLHDAETLVGKFRRGVLVGEGQVIRAITSVPHAIPTA